MKNATKRLSVKNAIDFASGWYVNGDLYSIFVTDEYGAVTVTYYTVQELTAHDPRVVQALELLFSNKRITGSDVANCLRRSVRHWDTPYLACGDPRRDIYVGFGYFGEFHRFVDASTPGYVSAVVWCFDIKTTSSGVDVALEQRLQTCSIPEPWMEQHYPGSVYRILVAQSLGLTDADVVAAAFDTGTPASAVTLPDEMLSMAPGLQ